MRTLALHIAALLPVAAYGYDFKGLELGAVTTKEAVVDATGLRCGAGVNGILVCNGDTSIATVPAYGLINLDTTGRLYRVELNFKSRGWALVKDALITKFGPPTTTTNSEMQNAYGAKFADERLMWLSENGDSLVAHRYAGRITDSSVRFWTRDFSEAERARQPDPHKDL